MMESMAAIGSSRNPHFSAVRSHDGDKRKSTWRTSLIGFLKQQKRNSRNARGNKRTSQWNPNPRPKSISKLTISRPLADFSGNGVGQAHVPLFMAADMIMVGDAIMARQEELEKKFGLGEQQLVEKSAGAEYRCGYGRQQMEYSAKDVQPTVDLEQQDHGAHPLRQNAVAIVSRQASIVGPKEIEVVKSTSKEDTESSGSTHEDSDPEAYLDPQHLGPWVPAESILLQDETELATSVSTFSSNPSSPTSTMTSIHSATPELLNTTVRGKLRNSVSLEGIERLQTHVFKLPLELRNQIYDYVLDLDGVADFSCQEPLKYNVSPALGYPVLENYSSISVNMSRSWRGQFAEYWCYCYKYTWKHRPFNDDDDDEDDEPTGLLFTDIKRRFCERTTFVISISASFPGNWYPADADGRYDFLDKSNEMQLLHLLSDKRLKHWLPFVHNIKLILLLSTPDGFAAGHGVDTEGREWKTSARYAAITKIAWILQHCEALNRLDVSVTLTDCRATTEEWVWSYLEPLMKIRGVRCVSVNGISLKQEKIEEESEDGDEEKQEREPDAFCEAWGMARYKPVVPLKWERGDEKDEGEDEEPSVRFPMFDEKGRYRSGSDEK